MCSDTSFSLILQWTINDFQYIWAFWYARLFHFHSFFNEKTINSNTCERHVPTYDLMIAARPSPPPPVVLWWLDLTNSHIHFALKFQWQINNFRNRDKKLNVNEDTAADMQLNTSKSRFMSNCYIFITFSMKHEWFILRMNILMCSDIWFSFIFQYKINHFQILGDHPPGPPAPMDPT